MPKSNHDKVITMTYYAFTSLSTVGLGDYHPVTSWERSVCAFILLFGVAITSLIIENFMRMILQMNNLRKSFEESDKLSLFLGTMEKFNGDRSLDPYFVAKIESYFNYRWANNKNHALST